MGYRTTIHNPASRQFTQNCAGFTLIFVSILLTVAALIFVSLLPGQEAGDYNIKTINNVHKLERVEEAMRSFMAMNCRRPCPADGQYAENTQYFGAEASSSGTCTGSTPAAPLGPDAGTGYIVGGVIPTRSLGLPDEYQYDEFGRQFTYVVDTRATSASSCVTLQTSIKAGSLPGGGVTIENTNGGTIIDNVMYAYITHGVSGYGAWPEQGSPNGALTPAQSVALRINSGSTDTDMQVNAGVDHPGVGGTFTYNTTNFSNVKIQKDRVLPNYIPGDTGFDDLLWYRPDLKNTCTYNTSSGMSNPTNMPFDFICQTAFPGSSSSNRLFAYKYLCGQFALITPPPDPFNGGAAVNSGWDAPGPSAVSPNDNLVAVGGTTLYIFYRSGSTYPYLTTLSDNIATYNGNSVWPTNSLQFSPDGNYLLVSWSAGPAALYSISGTGSSTTFTQIANPGFLPMATGGITGAGASYSADGHFIFTQEMPVNYNAYNNNALILTVYINNGATVTYASSVISTPTAIYTVSNTQSITGVTKANPGVVTVPAHGLANGALVYINNVVGMTKLNSGLFTVANATANTFTLKNAQGGANVSTTGYAAYTSGGTVYTLTQVGTETGASGNWSAAPNGLTLIQGNIVTSTDQLMTLNSSGNPTVVSPSPFPFNSGWNGIAWLSNTTAAVFSTTGGQYGVLQVNTNNTITWLQSPATLTSPACSNNVSPLPMSLSPDKSTIAWYCGGGSYGGIQIWKVTGGNSVSYQYEIPGPATDGGPAIAPAWRNQ